MMLSRRSLAALTFAAAVAEADVEAVLAQSSVSTPNVLYMVSDDMRPEFGCYGQPRRTPNIDGLAREGVLFNSAYTQFAYCAPSRNSFMTGRRPERTRCLNFLTDFRREHGDAWVSMPQLFKNAGYFTTAAGKLYHDGMDDPASWSDGNKTHPTGPYPSNQTQWIQCKCDEGDVCDESSKGPKPNFCAITNASRVPYTDEDLALGEGLKRLDHALASGKPWYVAIGVHRPHVETRLPPGWWGTERYPDKASVLPPKHPLAPRGAPWMSGNWYAGDYLNPAREPGFPNRSIPAVDAIEYRRWYYAGVEYVDHMLGKAMQRLESEPDQAARTITIFHADHGYQLGEGNEWSKKTDTELAVRVPLIVRVPWKTATAGTRTDVRAELVDIYRTLASLAGLSDAVQSDVQGTSLAPIFDGGAPPAALASKPAFSQIGSCACQVYTRLNWTARECDAGRCFHTAVEDFDFMGYTMRTAEGYRYTAWAPMNASTKRVEWGGEVHDELYDLRADKGDDMDYDGYDENVAPKHADVVARLRKELVAAVESWY